MGHLLLLFIKLSTRMDTNPYDPFVLFLQIENICARPWTFERVPNKMLSGLDNALVFTATKESCLAACLNEVSRPLAVTMNAMFDFVL